MKSSGQSDPFRHRQLPDPVSVGSLERPRHQGGFSVGDRAFRGRAVGESGIDAVIEVDSVPLLPGTRELAEAGAVTGDSRRNLDWADRLLDRGDTGELDVLLLADAQTAGGLLFGAESARAQEAVTELRATGHTAAVIGNVVVGDGRLHLA